MRLRELGMSIILILFGVCLLMGCRSASVEVSTAPPAEGPPPHAPAHGYRAHHVYHYYPSVYVYYEPVRKLYFYYDNGVWRSGVTLPNRIKISVGDRVIIRMDSDRPYTKFKEHRRLHPPPPRPKKGVRAERKPAPRRAPRARRR